MVFNYYKPGGLATFNINFGYVEALVRGYRNGFINDAGYRTILQCENLSDVRLNLQETDYGAFCADVQTLSPSILRDKALDKLVTEFQFLRANADQPLAQFLDFITYEYMIDNVMLVLKATLSNPSANLMALVKQAHPLGQFDRKVLESIGKFDNNSKGYSELYSMVLIDTPVGKYFAKFLEAEGSKSGGSTDVQQMLESISTTKLESSLRKFYMEDFYAFCQEIGGDTAEIMCDLLNARADATAINITLNSFGTPLNEPNLRQAERKPLYPNIGHLYPEGTEKLSNVSDENELANVLRPYKVYHEIFSKHQRGDQTIDDAFYEREVQLNELAFEGQFHFAAFYSYVRLKEQEIRNLVWICECIVQRQKDRTTDHFVSIFSKDAPYRAKD